MSEMMLQQQILLIADANYLWQNIQIQKRIQVMNAGPHSCSLLSPSQLNPDVNVFQRKFVNEVRRCEEMDRKLSE